MIAFRLPSLALAVLLLAACDTPPPPAAHVEPLQLAVEGRDNAGPGIAAAGRTVAVAWTAASAGAPADVFVAVSRDGGRTFAAPLRVNAGDGDVRTSGEQAPRVVARAGTIAVVWAARRAGLSEILIARSTDDGQTFSEPVPVHAPGLPGIRGWHSASISADGAIDVVWLDGRHAASAPSDHAHHDEVMTRESPRQDVFRARLGAGDPAVEALVATDVCFCCKTTVAAGPDGTIAAGWRHIYPGQMRDMAVARFGVMMPPADAGIVRVSEDGWSVNGCPEDGPTLAIDAVGRTHVVWPTMLRDGATKGIFHATLAPNATSFSARERVDDDNGRMAAHPQLALVGDEGLAVVWEEIDADGRRILLRRRDPDGGWRSAAQPLNGDVPGSYPVVAASGEALLVAWVSRTPPRSTIALARLPLSP